jgi:hypothetical protein
MMRLGLSTFPLALVLGLGLSLGATGCGAAEDAAFNLSASPLADSVPKSSLSDRYRVGGVPMDPSAVLDEGPSEEVPSDDVASVEGSTPDGGPSFGQDDNPLDADPSGGLADGEHPGMGSNGPLSGHTIADDSHNGRGKGQRQQGSDLEGIVSDDSGSGSGVGGGAGSGSSSSSSGGVALSQGTLWPPNHRMVSIDVVGSQSADCSIIDVWNNETNLESDAVITGALTLQLRASRAGTSRSGRIYTVKLSCLSAEGSTLEKHLEAVVSHDQRKK